jgi:hypothetical protein
LARKIEISETDLRIVETMAGRGAILDDIACVIGISASTLDRWLKHDQVKLAYKKGRAIAKDNVAGKLYDLAMSGDTIAAIFWLKAQAGWSDKQNEIPLETAQVQIYMPQRVKREDDE